MYTVNTSFMVEPDIHAQWLEMVSNRYIPLLRTQGFDKILFSRILSIEPTEHFTYSLQINIQDLQEYKKLTEEILAEYAAIASDMFGNKALYFTSLLKHIEI